MLGGGLGIGVDIKSSGIRGAAVRLSGQSRLAQRLVHVGLGAGVLAESFTEPNVSDMAAFVTALSELAGRLGPGAGKLSVALPDHAARVVMVDFDVLPDKRDETEKVLRWRLKKLLPYDVEKAELRYQYLGASGEAGAVRHRFLTTLITEDILRQYESAFRAAGLKVRSIGLASFAGWNLYRDLIMAGSGDARAVALMNLLGGKMTVMVFEGGVPRFFRLKDLGMSEGASGGGAVDSGRLVRELSASLTFYRENFGGPPVGRVFVAGELSGMAKVAEGIAAGQELPVRLLRPTDAVEVAAGAVPEGGADPYGVACGAALER
jgi:type IV pilus assembly protein PilM